MTLGRFPDDEWPLAWEWLQQFPQSNFDDFGPQSLAQFETEMRRRLAAGEVVWSVRDSGGELAGIVGFLPMSPRWGMLHGICFDKRVHGSGLPRVALRAVLAELYSAGFSKVSAWYFVSNRRIHRFLRALGAEREGLLIAQTVCAGVPVDMNLVAFFKPEV